jgi:drug/metabolite transporter (DMT)-like permease
VDATWQTRSRAQVNIRGGVRRSRGIPRPEVLGVGVRLKPALFMVGAALFWAGNYVVGAVAVRTMSAFDLTYLRWAIAVIPLLLIAQLVERPDWRAVVKAWPLLLLLGGLGMLAYNLLLYAALNFTTAAGASLVNAANPATMALLAVLLTRERLRGRAVVGIALSCAGVLLILSGGDPGALRALDVNVGQALMVGAVVVFSLYSIWGKLLRNVPPITATAAQAVLVLVVMSPVALANGVTVPTDPEPLLALVYIGLFPSVGAYVLWNLALRDTAPSVAGIYLNLVTVFTVLLGLLLGEAVPLVDLLGGAIVIVGVLVTSGAGRGNMLPPRAVAREETQKNGQHDSHRFDR